VRKTQRGLAHSELVQRIFRRQEYLSCDDVVLAVDIILDAIAAHLARGGPIQIHRLGTFTTRCVARVSRAIQTPGSRWMYRSIEYRTFSLGGNPHVTTWTHGLLVSIIKNNYH